MNDQKFKNSGLFEIQTGDRSPDRIMQNRQAARVHFRRILFLSSWDEREYWIQMLNGEKTIETRLCEKTELDGLRPTRMSYSDWSSEFAAGQARM